MDWEHDGGACLFWINWVIVWVCSPPISPLRVGLGVIISICDDVGSSRQKRGGSADFVGK
jgi:hypothetical protein